jgi:hypothetical protein
VKKNNNLNIMTSVTKEQFAKDIINFFESSTGMTIKEAQKKIKQSIIIDKFGNTDNDRIKTSNVTLFFTNNENYCGGLKNGYGKGWYLSNGGFTGGSTIKISNNL